MENKLPKSIEQGMAENFTPRGKKDCELTELRDTLAIEITREFAGNIQLNGDHDTMMTLFESVYHLADAVLSGRDRNIASLVSTRITQEQSDEAFVRANWPGICHVYSNEPGCPAGCISIKLGGRVLEYGDVIYADETKYFSVPPVAWAEARRMTEERMGVRR